MKKTALLFVGILLLASLSAFSQTQSATPTDVFAKTVPIAKIYTDVLGYKVLYVKSNLEIGALYVPLKWFGKAAGKGMIIWENPGAPSYFSIFWVDGKFDHLVLHVPANLTSPVWGVLETSQDLTAQFNVEEPQLTF